jgi:hypothetical protein
MDKVLDFNKNLLINLVNKILQCKDYNNTLL